MSESDSWPPSHLQRIREEIMESAQDAISGIGEGRGVLGVRLWADQLEVAASLYERYGDAVVLTVGYFPYPDIELGITDVVWPTRSHPTFQLSRRRSPSSWKRASGSDRALMCVRRS